MEAIESGRLPGDALDDIPCKYIDGSLVCEVCYLMAYIMLLAFVQQLMMDIECCFVYRGHLPSNSSRRP